MNIYNGSTAAAGVLAVLMISCAQGERNGGAAPPDEASVGSEMAVIPGDSEGADQQIVLFMGTSLTAGLGLSPEQSYPAVVQQKIEESSLPFRTVNAGVSGETSAGALRRIDWLLQQPFDVLVIETGANDMLRGVDPAEVESNIRQMIRRVREARPDAGIVLAGMRAAPNLGSRYVGEFESLYTRLAEAEEVELLPFLLEDVAAVPSLNQADGIHPNPEGQREVAENVWEVLEPLLRKEAEG